MIPSNTIINQKFNAYKKIINRPVKLQDLPNWDTFWAGLPNQNLTNFRSTCGCGKGKSDLPIILLTITIISIIIIVIVKLILGRIQKS